jgi:hypothetical protein
MATVFDDSESDIEIILDGEPMDSEGEKLVEKRKSRRRERLEARNRPRRPRSRTPENVRRSRAMSQRFEEVDDAAPEGAVYQEMKQDRLTYMPESAPRRYPVLRFYPEDEKTSQEVRRCVPSCFLFSHHVLCFASALRTHRLVFLETIDGHEV